MTTMDVLEPIDIYLEDEQWKNKILTYIDECTKKIDKEDIYTLRILKRLNLLIERNRTFEARRVVIQEKENLLGITEQKCKRRKINQGYCKVCTNINCNLNEKEQK